MPIKLFAENHKQAEQIQPQQVSFGILPLTAGFRLYRLLRYHIARAIYNTTNLIPSDLI